MVIEFIKNNWFLITIGVIVLFTILRVQIRGYFWKSRDGSELVLSDFFKRWGQGIEGITNLQSVKTQMLGTWIVITGMIAGLIINLLTRIAHQWHWISIILFGSLIITGMSMVALYQRYKLLKRVDDTIKELESE